MPREAVAGPTSRKARSEETRTALLEGTVRCLCEHGYAATTTGKVAALCGVTRGAILHHFSTKVDLILATALHVIEVQNAFRRSVMAPAVDPFERLVAVTDAVWASWQRPHGLALLEIDLGSRGDPELAARYPAIRRQIEAQQRERFAGICRDAGIDDRRFSDALVVLSTGAMRGMTIQAMLSGDRELVEESMALLKRMRRDLLAQMVNEIRQA
jgi:AcrR family transcriptional regulator